MNANTAKEKLSQFNQEGATSILVSLFGTDNLDIESTVHFINLHADRKFLKPLVFQPLKVNEKYLVFINPSLDVEVTDTDTVNLKKVLNQIKLYDKENHQSKASSIALRCLLLSIAKSELKSYDVFTNFDTHDIDKVTLRRYLNDEKSWISERVQIHNVLIRRCYKSAEALSQKIVRSKKLGKGIYCVRGSVASGKSSFIESILHQNIKTLEAFDGVLNTDAVKRQLILNTSNVTGQALSGYLFHEEASIIGEKILEIVRKSNLGYVVDKRMQDPSDLDELLADAAQRKLSVTIFDLKVDFITSALRVLERTGVYPSDPTPDFSALYKSYRTIEEGRLSFLEKSIGSKLVKNYSTVLINSHGHPVVTSLKKDYKVNKKNIARESEVRYIANAENLKDTVLSNKETLQSALDRHSRRIYTQLFSKEEYLNKLLRNIENTSRTFGGELNVSASKDKASLVNLFMPKQDLADTTRNNVIRAFDFAYDNKNLLLLSPQILQDFIDQIARIINRSIVTDEKLFIRSGRNSHKYFYVDTQYVKKFYKSFINQLYEKMNSPETAPADLAAWIEWNIDFCGHIFVDGCGRIAKILSTWLLMRNNSDLPDYCNGQDGFETVRESYRKRFALKSKVNLRVPTDTKNFHTFLSYYRGLFEPKETYKILASGGLIYNSTGQFLILQTSKGKDYGKWVIPGGKLDMNETPIEAFVREVFEETRLTVGHINLLGVRDYTAKSGNHYHFYDYTSVVVEDKKIRINEESLAFKWITKDQIPSFKFTDSIANFISKYFVLERQDIYSKVIEVPEKNFDVPYQDDHTMTSSLEKYIQSKLPVEMIESKVKEIDRVEVHGIYPDLKVLNELTLGFNITEVIHFSKQKTDNSNSLRPMFLVAKKGSKKLLVCCVTPGRDLLIHYASMLKYYLRDLPIPVSAYAYPLAEKRIDKWTGLDDKMIIKNDTVILGYSTFLRNQFEKDPAFSILSTYQNKYYSATRFITKNGKVINCLEANYGHWGDISDFLAQKICQLHAAEVLHIGKVGALKSPNEVYTRIYIPKSFVIGRRNEIMSIGSRISNSMEYIKEYSALAHVSISTTMEETFAQRESFSKKKIDTIDIESSKIARAVALYNLANKTKVKFGAIHFSSDYLKRFGEGNQSSDVDLSTDRENLRHKKQSILTEISSIIKKHILEK
jgi:ADP-ribose pyrophosphatase YjhB (NUDIX family)